MRSSRRGAAGRAVIALLVALLGSYAPACDDHDHDGTGPTDAVYFGGATDEGLAAFEGAGVREDAARAPLLTNPAPGSTVGRAPPPGFSWKPTPTSLEDRARARRRPAPRRFALTWGPPRLAHAHGAPMNGRAYLLTFRSGGATLVRVFTQTTSYVPDEATWRKIADAGAVEVVLATASFDNGNVVQGSGPYAAPPVTLTIAP